MITWELCFFVAFVIYTAARMLVRVNRMARTVRPADAPALPSDIVTTYSVVEE